MKIYNTFMNFLLKENPLNKIDIFYLNQILFYDLTKKEDYRNTLSMFHLVGNLNTITDYALSALERIDPYKFIVPKTYANYCTLVDVLFFLKVQEGDIVG